MAIRKFCSQIRQIPNKYGFIVPNCFAIRIFAPNEWNEKTVRWNSSSRRFSFATDASGNIGREKNRRNATMKPFQCWWAARTASRQYCGCAIIIIQVHLTITINPKRQDENKRNAMQFISLFTNYSGSASVFDKSKRTYQPSTFISRCRPIFERMVVA